MDKASKQSAECPPHEHVTVDESHFWALQDLFIEAHSILKRTDDGGDISGDDVRALRYFAGRVDEELARSRRMNEAMPHHHSSPTLQQRLTGGLADWRDRLHRFFRRLGRKSAGFLFL